jgi:hypothetical protein
LNHPAPSTACSCHNHLGELVGNGDVFNRRAKALAIAGDGLAGHDWVLLALPVA